jgi:transcriptional regulator with XRE-family HTH domain
LLLKCYYYIINARAFGDFCQNKEKMMKKTTEELMEILKQKKSIHAYFTEEIDELEFASLTEYLELLLNEKGLRKSDVIKRSNMDKNYAYQIFNGNKTHPSRDKMIALAIGMGLNVLETRKLLKIAGACDLYPRNPRDSVIIFGLNNRLSLIDTNELLNDYRLDLLE